MLGPQSKTLIEIYKKSEKTSVPRIKASLLNSPTLQEQGDHLKMQSEDYVLTLAGFEALQLLKLPKGWSPYLGRANVSGNTPSFHGCLDPRIFSELSETSFLCVETALPEDGMWSGGGSRQALLCHTE